MAIGKLPDIPRLNDDALEHPPATGRASMRSSTGPTAAKAGTSDEGSGPREVVTQESSYPISISSFEALAPASRSNRGGSRVRLGIHDASRIEWSVSLALPVKDAVRYDLEVELQIPSNAFVRHSPWDQLQSFTRLDSPEGPGDSAVATIDTLRKEAVAIAHRLTRLHESLARYCRAACSLVPSEKKPELDSARLRAWIAAARDGAGTARSRLCEPANDEPIELTRERRLVDEYVSVRLLEFYASAERAFASTLKAGVAMSESSRDAVRAAGADVTAALASELEYRRKRGFIAADAAELATLERYLDRASRLKKHFQEVLFLETEVIEVAERIHHVVAAFVAVVASTWAFFWQIALAQQAVASTGGRIGSGLVFFAVIIGIVYAGKDRIKEIGRTWISGRVHRLYAQRVARYRAPAKRVPSRDVVASAKESFNKEVVLLPDPLNPECGANHLATVIRYQHKGSMVRQRELAATGVTGIKHVFRYDLTPMFSRLDDATKQVPVLDVASHCVRFVDAPRCYRVPVSVRVTVGGVTTTEERILVLHKRGLDRMERVEDLAEPDLVDAGPEPT
ncbi:MAG: hypothetical protein U0174_24300 [Polyangiaceae bacterium]